MTEIGILNVFGLLGVLALIIGIGVYSGKKVKNADDFSIGGGKTGSWLVCGGIMGALVSSQATIGTAQLAFNFGISAWWFTLGSGGGCLLLAVIYSRPLRHSGCTTLVGVISKEYGSKVGYTSSALSSIGIFISVLAQMVACTGIITVIFSVSVLSASLISMAIMAGYVIFGGSWGAGLGGIAKIVLLYATCIISCVVVLYLTDLTDLVDGLKGLLIATPLGQLHGVNTSADISSRFGSLVARGAARDIGSGISLLLGVLSTQTYAQAIWAGSSDKTARRGGLLSAILIPPIGVVGIIIGLYMRANYITQGELDALLAAGHGYPEGRGLLASTVQVFPMFVVNHLPAVVGGIGLGALLVSMVGGGAGLSLGVATILVSDVFKRLFTAAFDKPRTSLLVTRVTIMVILLASAVIASVVPSATINDYGFLSMALRAAVVFVPMTCALFLPGKVNRTYILAAVIAGPLGVIAGKLANVPFDPLFIGIGLNLVFCLAGFLTSSKKNAIRKSEIGNETKLTP